MNEWKKQGTAVSLYSKPNSCYFIIGINESGKTCELNLYSMERKALYKILHIQDN